MMKRPKMKRHLALRLLRIPSAFVPLAVLVLLSMIGNGEHPFAAAIALASDPPIAVADFIEQNCVSCHDSGTTEGDLDLEALAMDLENPDNFHHWERVYDRVRTGEMPPDEELDKAEKKTFVAALGKSLLSADAAHTKNLGRVSARRLTRAQYERNVCQLLKIDVPLQTYLPAESLDDGFDTVSSSQQISDHSLLAYLEAADVALDTAFERVLESSPEYKVRLDWTKLRRNDRRPDREPEGRPKQKDVVSWSTRSAFHGRMRNTAVKESGRYRIRLRVQAVNPPKDGRVWCGIESGFGNNRESTLYWIGGFEATKNPLEYEFVAWMKEGHKLIVSPRDSALRNAKSYGGNIVGKFGSAELKGVPGVAIKWIEMERLDNVVDAASRQALIGKLSVRRVSGKPNGKKGKGKTVSKVSLTNRREVVSRKPESDLRKLTHEFAQRAFRQPVTEDQVKIYSDFAIERFKESKSFQVGLRAGYRAILCSPRFLYFEETPGKLDDYALANRLSHFLWGKGPDAELLKLAADGTIGNSKVLLEQVERLLNAPQSEVFVKEFTEQWLKLYEIDDTTPDAKLYPEYDDVLHHSMLDETHAFVAELIDRDLPITNVVDSKFTYLHSRLARHYEIDWPGGTGMKRVKLKKSDRRGGIITHASVLKVTANGTSTSPILRGVWMMERVVGLHVPPPPSNTPAVEPDIRGATSIRTRLAKHRNLESCAACHVKIDPPGFALESYDVIGGYRTKYRTLVSKKGKTKRAEGKRVDPSYTFPSGKKFSNVDGLKKLMLKQPEQLAKAFASHLITYATGAEPTFADRKGIGSIAKTAQTDKYGARSIIKNVVLSPQFRYK